MSLENGFLTTDAAPDAPRRSISPPRTEEKIDVEPPPKNKITATFPVNAKKKYTNNERPKTKKPPSAKTSACTKVINIVNSKGIHVGAVNNYNLYANGNNKSEKSPESVPRTEAVDKLLASMSVVRRHHLDVISTHLGEGWRDVGVELGYSSGQMDHFYDDNHHLGNKEIIYQMLLDWTRMKADDAILGDLTRILWHLGQKDVVVRLANSL